MFDETTNPTDVDQAAARIHGQGQKGMKTDSASGSSSGPALPVKTILFVHAFMFVGLGAAEFLRIRRLGDAVSAVMVIVLGFLICGLIMTIAMMVFYHNQRLGRRLVAERNPGATIVTMAWSGMLLPSFVTSSALLKGANMKGFNVDVVASAQGLSFWRGGRRIVELGTIPWASLRSIEPSRFPAAIGSRLIESVVFEFDYNPTLLSPITLVPNKKEPTAQIVDRLLTKRP